jgi:hypothetical protein
MHIGRGHTLFGIPLNAVFVADYLHAENLADTESCSPQIDPQAHYFVYYWGLERLTNKTGKAVPAPINGMKKCKLRVDRNN